MIALKELVRSVQTMLDQNGKGKSFRIFGDTDDFVRAIRSGNVVAEYVNGLMQILESSVAPTQELVVATQTARLEFVFPIEDPDEEQTIQDQVGEYREILSETFQQAVVQVLKDETGRNFSVGVYGTPAQTGGREQRQIIGDSMSLVVYLYYSFIENGLNSFDCPVYLDGVRIPYSTMNIARVPTMEGNPYANEEGVAKNRTLASAISVQMTVPATTDGAVSAAVLAFLMHGDADVHTLKIQLGEEESEYPVLFGQTDMSMDGLQNAGFNLNFVEAVEYGTV